LLLSSVDALKILEAYM